MILFYNANDLFFHLNYAQKYTYFISRTLLLLLFIIVVALFVRHAETIQSYALQIMTCVPWQPRGGGEQQPHNLDIHS